MTETTPRKPKPLVFVAAVYEGNATEYAHGLVRAAWSLRAASRLVPVLPDFRLLSEDYAGERFAWESDLIERCEALVVIGGRDVPAGRTGAEGVERWVDVAARLGLRIFDGPGSLFEWVAEREEAP